ncbi:mCG145856, partial [Mus musculus]
VKPPLVIADIQVGQIHAWKHGECTQDLFCSDVPTCFSFSSLACASSTLRQFSCGPTMCCSLPYYASIYPFILEKLDGRACIFFK